MNNTGEKQSKTKQKIRQTAIELFKENGYDNVSVVQICQACGVTKRTFYYHFSSKEEIIDTIIARVGQETERMAEAMLTQQSNIGVLWHMMKGYAIDSEINGPVITGRVFLNKLQNSDEIRFPQDMILYNAVVRTIRNAQHAGEISNPQPAEDVAFALYHTLRSVNYTWSCDQGSYSLVEAFKRSFTSVLGILIPMELAFDEDA